MKPTAPMGVDSAYVEQGTRRVESRGQAQGDPLIPYVAHRPASPLSNECGAARHPGSVAQRAKERPPFPVVNAKEYAKAKAQWLDQISEDPDLTHFAFRVGYRVAKHHNREKGYAYPTHAVLAQAVGAVGTRGVKAAIDALVRRGHLSVEFSRGRGNANRYFLIRKGKVKPGHFPSDENVKMAYDHVPF